MTNSVTGWLMLFGGLALAWAGVQNKSIAATLNRYLNRRAPAAAPAR